MTRFICLGLLLGLSISLIGQTPSRKAAVLLSATVNASPAQVNLSWPSHNGANSYQIYRRAPGVLSWGSPISSLSGSAQGYSDQQVQVGIAYEYKVLRQGNGTGYGFLRSGIKVDATSMHSRGKMILLVESALAVQMQTELAQLEDDLLGDGWFPVRLSVSANDNPINVRNQVITIYNNDPSKVKALYIIGNVPVPYSGYVAPDGHGSHQGAWPCDGYYGDMNGAWSDAYVWTTNAATSWNHNVPGDGKFDQSDFGSPLELAVGRLYLGDMPAFPKSELVLTKEYLAKAHGFKLRQWEPAVQAAVYDNLSYISGGSMASTGYQAAAAMVGFANVADVNPGDQLAAQNLNTDNLLFSYRCGNGTQETYQNNVTFIGINNMNLTSDIVANGNGSVFNMSFGSYFGDWDNYNNYLRALIAKGNGLTSVWSGIPNWYMHAMGMGEPVGECAKVSMNNTDANYTNQNGGWQGPNMSRVQMGLMGDPSLRMRMMAPPNSLSASANGYDISFTWSASPNQGQGYYLYRINDASETIERISPLVTSTSFTATNIPYIPGQRFMVRAAKIRTTASGSYEDLSIGAIAQVSGTLIPDCAGVVGGAAYPGSPCNDGDINTQNDQYDSSCNCSGEVPGITTACYLLGGSNDPDMEESSNGGIYANTGALDLVYDSDLPWNWRGNQFIGMHFTNVSIPQGATIVDAYVQFTANGTENYNPVQLIVAAEASANGSELNYGVGDISLRTRTQNTVNWSPGNWNLTGESGQNQRTPDLSSIIQELVYQSGWSTSNAINLLLSGYGGRQAFSWNQDPTKAARLCVSYQEGSSLPVDCLGIAGGSSLPGSVCDDGDANTTNDILDANCNCFGNELPPNGNETCITISSSSNADVEESDAGGIYGSAGAFDLVYDSELPWNWRGNQQCGLFFEGLSIPQGANIESAYIQFAAQGTTNYNPILLNISAEDNVNPTPFGYQMNDLSMRSLISNSVQWSPGDWNTVGAQGTAQRTPDLSVIVQSLVSRSDWNVSKELAIIISGYGGRQAFSSEQDISKAPKLCIVFNTDGPNLPVDCLGVAGGAAVIDDCGVCNGNNDCLNTNAYACFSISGNEDNDQEESSSGGMYANVGALDLVFDSELPWNWRGAQTVGMRFTDLGIPQGAIITNASLLFTVFDTVNYNPCEIAIGAEASDNALPFSWGANDISNRALTNALVGWNPANWNVLNAAGGSQTTPDLSSVMQEVIDRPGWSTGNTMLFVMSGSGGRQAYSSNQDESAAPKLCVSWLVPNTQNAQRNIHAEHATFGLYPNPNRGEGVTLELNNSVDRPIQTTAILRDVYGKLLLEHSFIIDVGGNKELLPLGPDLAKGVYFVTVKNATMSLSKQLIIE